jgi:bifunctional NMN adenylyltransferase/nudix hydrolase
MTKFDALLCIFRCQPFTKAHESVIRAARKQAKFTIVGVGSSFAARDVFKNPFTFEERRAMIKAVFPEEDVLVVPIVDYPDDDISWVLNVQNQVANSGAFGEGPDVVKRMWASNVALIGHKKDASSYYIKIFPNWSAKAVDVPAMKSEVTGNIINATDVRQSLFLDAAGLERNDRWMKDGLLSEPVINLIKSWFFPLYGAKRPEWVEWSLNEYKFNLKYKASMQVGQPILFEERSHMTADALVTWGGKVLLVERKNHPGKGQWALPGGFKKPGETFLQACLRELKEETKLKVPEKVLRGSIVGEWLEDNPKRSNRGCIVTKVFHIDLGFDLEEPKAKASDDAKKAKWTPVNQIKRDMMFEDHYNLINRFIKSLG